MTKQYHPQSCNFTVDIIDNYAKDKSKLALRHLDLESHLVHDYTFYELAEASKKAANLLKSYGFQAGDKVFIMLPNIPQWWVVMLSLHRLGCIPVPATTQLTPQDIKYRFEAIMFKGIITIDQFQDKFLTIKNLFPNLHYFAINATDTNFLNWDNLVSQAVPEIESITMQYDDDALLYFTSGTTGHPKMVMHKQSYLFAHQITGEDWLGLGHEDIHWCITDPGWAKAAWSTLYGPWNQGAAVFCCQLPKKFDPALVLSILEKHNITSFCSAPTGYRMLVKHGLNGHKLAALKNCTSAGEPLNPEVITLWHKHTNIMIRDGYGQTESIVLIANCVGQKVKPGSMGRPIRNFKIAVVDDTGKQLANNTEGNIAIHIKPSHPIGIFDNYFGHNKEGSDHFIGEWYLTGDRATIDDDGYYWFVGRNDDVMIPSGYRVGPFEVESLLIEHPAVLETGVVAKPDDERGQIIKAYCILNKSYLASEELARELQSHIKSLTAAYKCPREIAFVEALPKTVSGKIQRNVLRKWALDEYLANQK